MPDPSKYVCIYTFGPRKYCERERQPKRRRRKMCGKENRKQQFYAKYLFRLWVGEVSFCCASAKPKRAKRARDDDDDVIWCRELFHRSRKAKRHTGLCALVWLPSRITRQNSPTSMYLRAGYVSASYTYVSSLLIFRNNVDFRATSNIILGWSALCPCVYTTWIPSSRESAFVCTKSSRIYLNSIDVATVRIQIIAEVFPSAERLANSAAYNTRSLAMCAARNSCWQPKITCCARARARARRRNTQKK